MALPFSSALDVSSGVAGVRSFYGAAFVRGALLHLLAARASVACFCRTGPHPLTLAVRNHSACLSGYLPSRHGGILSRAFDVATRRLACRIAISAPQHSSRRCPSLSYCHGTPALRVLPQLAKSLRCRARRALPVSRVPDHIS